MELNWCLSSLVPQLWVYISCCLLMDSIRLVSLQRETEIRYDRKWHDCRVLIEVACYWLLSKNVANWFFFFWATTLYVLKINLFWIRYTSGWSMFDFSSSHTQLEWTIEIISCVNKKRQCSTFREYKSTPRYQVIPLKHYHSIYPPKSM